MEKVGLMLQSNGVLSLTVSDNIQSNDNQSNGIWQSRYLRSMSRFLLGLDAVPVPVERICLRFDRRCCAISCTPRTRN